MDNFGYSVLLMVAIFFAINIKTMIVLLASLGLLTLYFYVLIFALGIVRMSIVALMRTAFR